MNTTPPNTTRPQHILLVCPSAWDYAQIPSSATLPRDEYVLHFTGEEAEDHPATFDAPAFVEQTVRAWRGRRLDGVTSSSDYPGCIVAAAIAQELDLPGPAPATVLACSHKYYSRLAQQRAVPEATPRFALVDPQRAGDVSLPFPFFVKPVKSWFSILAEPMESPEQLIAFVARPDVREHLTSFVRPFNTLLRRYTDFEHDGSCLLAEELLAGTQVTVEGYSFQSKVEIMGVVDSVMFPGTKSFQRFDFPSHLPQDVQRRMAGIAARAIRGIGLDNSLFNVEMFYDQATGRISIIEINPRMCGQFADLMESVHGTNTYEILFALATGRRPHFRRRAGRFQVAASFPLRAFEDRRVVHLPDDARIAAVRERWPVTCVKSRYYREGQRLSDIPENSDGLTYRYGVVNVAGRDWPSLLADFEEVKRALDFRLAPASEQDSCAGGTTLNSAEEHRESHAQS
jgi:hypothetical protein